MTNKKIATPGTWVSSISAEMVASSSPRLAEPYIDEQRIFWLQTRPEEAGRNAIMMYHNGQSQCILPHPLSAKSKVHEYGGGSYTVNDNMLYFVLAEDQQIYRAKISDQSFTPEKLTTNENLRFADLCLDKQRNILVAVCEDHSVTKQEPKNYLISISLRETNEMHVLHNSHDFYSNPEISPDGTTLCWIGWNHPNMPWDHNFLYTATLNDDLKLTDIILVAGESPESIFQPQWSPDGKLYCVSDRNNWWNIYYVDNNKLLPVTNIHAEFATPQWTFNMSTYGFLNSSTILATYSQHGSWSLCRIDLPSGGIKNLNSECSYIYGISCHQDKAVFIGSSPTSLTTIYHVQNCDLMPLITSRPPINSEDISIPQAITFGEQDKTAYAFYYPPVNANYTSDSAPPMIVICHGGPTGATHNSLELKIQYWTNRGFAVMDVNYRGSTGYGREFRHQLHYQWGVYDVEDVCTAAQYAIENNLAKPGQCIIRGSSAGGYTVLAALAFTDQFDIGVSLYGIGDLETLVKDTHKFEARYLDSLVGDYPDKVDIYKQRSPIHYTQNISCPLLVYQGLEDKVVPPNQATEMVATVKQNQLPVAIVMFENEGHGFRRAENIQKMLHTELEFYQRILNLDGHSKILTIENWENN